VLMAPLPTAVPGSGERGERSGEEGEREVVR
jgi:hypothetical protein